MGADPLIIPPGPGVMSAFGFLTSDVQNEFSETYLETNQDVDGMDVHREFRALQSDATDWLNSEGVAEENHGFEYYADCRYFRQDIQMSIPVDINTLQSDTGLAKIKENFEARHNRQFGFSLDAPLEIANLRVIGKGSIGGASIESTEPDGSDPSGARVDTTEVYFNGSYHETPVYDRSELAPGNKIIGPAIVVEDDSTIIIQPTYTAKTDPYANLEITRGDE
jgi:N-methylhydantoinase A